MLSRSCLAVLVAVLTTDVLVTPTNGEPPLPAQLWTEIKPGTSVDLLPHVVLPDHVLQGTWKRIFGSITCEPAKDSMVMAPVAIDGSYELDVEFSRHSGSNVFVCFPVAGSSCTLSLALGKDSLHGLWFVNGRAPDRQPANSGVVFRPGRLVNNRRYHVHLEVKVVGVKAVVTVELEGKRILIWKGDPYSLLVPYYYARPVARSISVGIDEGAVDFYSMTLKIDRRSDAYLLGNDFQCPITQAEKEPPKEFRDACVMWNGRYYMMSDRPMSFVEAQRMAVTVRGRLLTISSREEEAVFLERGRGLIFWMAGWRRTDSNQWRDERNSPLRFMGNWASYNPGNSWQERYLAIQTDSSVHRGWHDCVAWNPGIHACVEWGLESPAGLK